MFHREGPAGYELVEWAKVAKAESTRSLLVAACQSQRFPIFIYGPVGTGKTCLAACMYRESRRNPLWLRADQLLVEMSQYKGAADLRKKLQRHSSLFLDDLGTMEPTRPMFNAFFDLLELRAQMPVIITSNHGPNEIAEIFDDRIRSRIMSGTVINLDGDDRRAGSGRRVRVTM